MSVRGKVDDTPIGLNELFPESHPVRPTGAFRRYSAGRHTRHRCQCRDGVQELSTPIQANQFFFQVRTGAISLPRTAPHALGSDLTQGPIHDSGQQYANQNPEHTDQ